MKSLEVEPQCPDSVQDRQADVSLGTVVTVCGQLQIERTRPRHEAPAWAAARAVTQTVSGTGPILTSTLRLKVFRLQPDVGSIEYSLECGAAGR